MTGDRHWPPVPRSVERVYGYVNHTVVRHRLSGSGARSTRRERKAYRQLALHRQVRAGTVSEGDARSENVLIFRLNILSHRRDVASRPNTMMCPPTPFLLSWSASMSGAKLAKQRLREARWWGVP